MNRFRLKVFFTIFTIMTSFILMITIVGNIERYVNEKNSIERSFNSLTEPIKEVFEKNPNNDFDDRQTHDFRYRVFMDQKVYSIRIENNEAKEIMIHTYETTDETKIKRVANKILKKAKNKKSIKIYMEDYSYFIDGDILVLVDNTVSRSRLLSDLKNSLVMFVIIELLITLVAYFLTKWITEPVEESFQKQKDFIADASHELKTPLSVIMANSEMLENNPKEKKWLQNIQSESERMNKLITNLLDLAKLEDTDNKETYEETNLSKLIEKSILPFESLLFERNIEFNYDLEDNIKYKCNQEEIKQLLAILLDNAIKHSEKKGEVNVTLKKGKLITITVSNKGREIKKEDLDHIFERFYRVDKSRNRDENRYGLGLAIAKKIVENHNGKINCISENSVTTFIVTLK